MGPVAPVDPIPFKPVGPVDPIKPTEPVDPVNPVGPVDPVKPTEPVDPTNPVGPVGPTDPVLPVGPIKVDLSSHDNVPAPSVVNILSLEPVLFGKTRDKVEEEADIVVPLTLTVLKAGLLIVFKVIEPGAFTTDILVPLVKVPIVYEFKLPIYKDPLGILLL